MNAYADTSFLISLYGRDPHSTAAESLARRERPTFLLTPFGEAEFMNACEMRVFLKEWAPVEARAVREDFLSDLRADILRVEAMHPNVWQTAISLSRRHTARLGTRALDVLHVAVALKLPIDAFLSLDERQRKLARAENLRVLPR